MLVVMMVMVVMVVMVVVVVVVVMEGVPSFSGTASHGSAL